MFLRSATQRQEVNSRKADEVFAEDAPSNRPNPGILPDFSRVGRTICRFSL